MRVFEKGRVYEISVCRPVSCARGCFLVRGTGRLRTFDRRNFRQRGFGFCNHKRFGQYRRIRPDCQLFRARQAAEQAQAGSYRFRFVYFACFVRAFDRAFGAFLLEVLRRRFAHARFRFFAAARFAATDFVCRPAGRRGSSDLNFSRIPNVSGGLFAPELCFFRGFIYPQSFEYGKSIWTYQRCLRG